MNDFFKDAKISENSKEKNLQDLNDQAALNLQNEQSDKVNKQLSEVKKVFPMKLAALFVYTVSQKRYNHGLIEIQTKEELLLAEAFFKLSNIDCQLQPFKKNLPDPYSDFASNNGFYIYPLALFINSKNKVNAPNEEAIKFYKDIMVKYGFTTLDINFFQEEFVRFFDIINKTDFTNYTSGEIYAFYDGLYCQQCETEVSITDNDTKLIPEEVPDIPSHLHKHKPSKGFENFPRPPRSFKTKVLDWFS